MLCSSFRSDTHTAAWPGPEIQDQHQGPFPRIWPVSSRSSYRHHQRDAASLQVGNPLLVMHVCQGHTEPLKMCNILVSADTESTGPVYCFEIYYLWNVEMHMSACFHLGALVFKYPFSVKTFLAKIGSRASVCQEKNLNFWVLPLNWKKSSLCD